MKEKERGLRAPLSKNDKIEISICILKKHEYLKLIQ